MESIPDQPEPLLGPLFAGEGGYVHLLHILLVSEAAFAESFRSRFSEDVLAPAGLPRVDRGPFTVLPEFGVVPAQGRGQWIDLVLRFADAIIGIEAKVFDASFRQHQLALQYDGLRTIEEESGVPVHMLLLSTRSTSRGLDFAIQRKGDIVANATWDSVLSCCNNPDSVTPDPLLNAVVDQARIQLKSIKRRQHVTPETPERQMVRSEVREAVRRLNDWFTATGGDLAGCCWQPKFSPRPDAEYFERSLDGPDGVRRRGQYLGVTLDYRTGVGQPLRAVPKVSVAFTVDGRNANRSYRAEWASRRDELVRLLPTPPVAHRDVERDGDRVVDRFAVTIRDGEVVCPDGRRLQNLLEQYLRHYVRTFAGFLLRDSRGT